MNGRTEEVVKLSVGDIMTRDVVTLKEDEDLALAEEMMQVGRIRHLPVVQNRQLVGLVTHRDLLRASFSALAEIDRDEEQRIKRSIPVKKIMATNLITVTSETPLLEAAQTMLKKKIGCLTVVDNGRLTGIITESDFLRLFVQTLSKHP